MPKLFSIPMGSPSTSLSSYLDAILGQVPKESPLYEVLLFQWSSSVFEKYQENQEPKYLEEALLRVDQAVEALIARDESDPALASWLDSYAHMLELQFERTKDLATLDSAISKSLRAVALPSEKSHHIIYLSNLGNLYEKKFDETKSEEALIDAISVAQRCVNMTTDKYENFPTMLYNLAAKLFKRFLNTGEVQFDELDKSIELQDKALRDINQLDAHLWRHLNNMRAMLATRYDHASRSEDLDGALRHAKRLVNEFSANVSMYPRFLAETSYLLRRRYDRDGKNPDLDSAIELLEHAITLLQDQNKPEGEYFDSLGVLLERKYDSNGESGVLQHAMEVAQMAIEMNEADDEERARSLNTLGNLLTKRFEATGEMEDLEEAIQISQRVIELSGNAPPANRSARLSALADKLDKRYERIGTMEDLEEAILKTNESIHLDPFETGRARGWTNLGNFEERKFLRYGEIQYLEKSCEYATKSLQLAKANNQNMSFLSACYNNLGNKLAMLSRATGAIATLDEAVDNADKAVAYTPKTHPDCLLYLNNLSNHLQTLYRVTVPKKQMRSDVSDGKEILERAIRSAQAATALTSDDDPRGAIHWFTLASSHRLCPEQSSGDIELEALMKAWNCRNGVPFHRIKSVPRLLWLLGEKNDWCQAVNIAKEAIKLLSIVNARFLSYDDQQFAVSHFSGLAADACSLLLQKGEQPYEALDLLEQGRGSILSILMDSRSDISKLRADDSKLARRFDMLRAEVSMLVPETTDPGTHRTLLQRRQRAAQDLQAVVETIRRLPGHSRFLLGFSEADLVKQASTGPIVVINVSEFRSDAIIVSQPGGVQAVQLTGMKVAEVKRWLRKDLTNFQREEFREKNKAYRSFLLWLWSECVRPVIESIKKTSASSNEKHRIWWIGTGLASSLPFHAAGDHSVESAENTISHAISSYTPTIKALGYTRESSSERFPADPKLLLVAMPTTPGEASLPGVSEEVKALNNVLAKSWSLRLEQHPDSNCVLKGLRDCEIAHFACHGFSSFQNPSKSHLILQRQDTPDPKPVQDHLTLQKIFDMGLKTSWIAYLSACSTAENKSQHLADEVLHIASGFQVSGFRHVIASMWPAADDVCVAVAKSFYQSIEKHWKTGISDDLVACALHSSVELVRDGLRRQPLAWAQFIHYGA